MADYPCPRCQKPVTRQAGGAIARAFGLVGVLMSYAFAKYECAEHGALERKDFAPEIQSKMRMGSMGFVIGAVVLFVALLAALVALNAF
jgi:uncharacterized membrane protein YidH (DUF202 family)